ncbi:MAG: ABC transporter transmembrane domain-containing protein [Allosphingosinicella sp.]|uniref:ABC transporter transmembrane domain-containing protein n=1 Tax=Allosphingosinicella sp. TaxID=2823234 RepID=UPI00393E3DD1
MKPILSGGRRRFFAALLAAALTQALAAAAAAWCVQHLFDELVGGSQAGDHDLRLLGGGFAAAAALGFAMEILQRRLGEGLALAYTAEVRLALFDRQLLGDGRRGGRQSHGTALLPFVGDLTALKQWVGSGLARSAAALITLSALLLILAWRSPLLAAALAATLGSLVLALLALGRPYDGAVREVRRRRGALAGFVSGRLAGATAVRAMARVRSERGKLAARTDALNRAGGRRAWISGALRATGQLAQSLLVLVTLLVGLQEIVTQRLTPGEVVGALALVGLLGAAVNDLARGLEIWYPAQTSRERIAKALRPAPRIRARRGRAGATFAPGLVLAELDLPPVLPEVSASALPGEVVRIDGAAGSGKSTLLGVIAQTVGHRAGEVFFDGRPLEALSARSLRRTVGFASPALPLLRGSFGMNLRYRHPEAGLEELAEIMSGCGLDRLVDRLPRGLRAPLADNGANLSTGERQTLLLARALLGSPPLLLLDSIDSHLDPDVIQWLTARLRAYPGIVLMTASRPELAAAANRVWRLDRGRLAEASLPTAPSLVPLFPEGGPTRNGRPDERAGD